MLGWLLLGIAVILYAGWLVLFAAITWLKVGVWYLETITEHFAIRFPMTTWVGLESILEWVVGLPFALGVFVFGFLLVSYAGSE